MSELRTETKMPVIRERVRRWAGIDQRRAFDKLPPMDSSGTWAQLKVLVPAPEIRYAAKLEDKLQRATAKIGELAREMQKVTAAFESAAAEATRLTRRLEEDHVEKQRLQAEIDDLEKRLELRLQVARDLHAADVVVSAVEDAMVEIDQERLEEIKDVLRGGPKDGPPVIPDWSDLSPDAVEDYPRESDRD